jgi:Fe-S cluster assembly protein SufD
MNDAALLPKDRGRAGLVDPAPALLSAILAEIEKQKHADPPWLAELRRESVRWLETRGFPLPNEESWRFTPIRPLLRVPYSLATASDDPASRIAGGSEVPSLLLENGRPKGALPNVPGLEVRRLSEVIRNDPGRVEPFFGKVARIADAFSAANTALFEDGLLIAAPRGSKTGAIHVTVAASPGARPTLGTPRILVVAEPLSEVRLVELRQSPGAGSYLDCAVTEIVVGDGARVEHVRVHHGEPSIASIATIAVSQGRDSHFASRVFTFGGAPARLDLRVALQDQGAECVLDGLYISRAGDLVDHQTTIDHAKPRCTSRERYKGAIEAEGVAVFDGTVLVRPGASGTEAHQENRNLCLSPDAVVHTKPHLEIDTDDVKCSHGATVGRLDPAQLFYLRARGLELGVARSVLTYAFAREMVETISDPALRSALEGTIAQLLPNGLMAKELA